MKLFFVNSNTRTWLLMATAILMLLLVLPIDAFASETGSGLPFEEPLTKLKDSLTGPVAFAISVIGVVAAGAMLIFGGDMNGFMRSMVFLVLVIGLIVGSSSILSKLFEKNGAVIDAGSALIVSLNNHGIC